MAKTENDASVLANIQRLVGEEHRLFERGELSPEETHRLAAVQAELDQCWDLLRQRRARRQYGNDSDEATVRDPSVVEHYRQ
jgi:hypothetical protein